MVMCPNGGASYVGHVIAQRTEVHDSWVFLGEIGRRVDPFDPSTTRTTRTTHPCIKDACPNHTDGNCIAGDYAATMPDVADEFANECPIVDTCRWRLEQGPHICRACPGINHWAMDPLKRSSAPSRATKLA